MARPVQVAVLSMLLVTGCARASKSAPPSGGSASMSAPAQAAQAQGSTTPKLDRKVIRTAELAIEVDAPDDVERKVIQLAEREGGYVVTSEEHRSETEDHDERLAVTIVLRVPADRFVATMDELRRFAVRVDREKIGSQDVTEEYVDLDARLRTLRALEDRMLGILKDAKTVKDALDVEKQLADTRTEIEKLEGRKRFLDTQTAMSTITVTVAKHVPLVATSGFGFGDSVRHAAADSVNVAAAIVTGGIRTTGVLLPIALFVGAPIWLVARAIRRRRRAVA